MRISLFILIIIFEHNQFTPISGDVWIETEGFVFNKDGGLQHCIQDEQLSDSQLESSFRVELDCLQPQSYLLDSNEWATSEYVHVTDS